MEDNAALRRQDARMPSPYAAGRLESRASPPAWRRVGVEAAFCLPNRGGQPSALLFVIIVVIVVLLGLLEPSDERLGGLADLAA